MKEKFLKAASTLPFWIPFPFIFLVIEYYLKQPSISIVIAALLGAVSFTYAAAGKTKEMLAGSAVGALLSLIFTSIVNDGFDEGWFSPLTSMSYVVVLAVMVLLIQLFGVLVKAVLKKIKNKIKKS